MKSPDLSRPPGVHACPRGFRNNCRPRECNLRGDAQRAFIALHLSRSHCARVGGALVIGRPTCILTGDCLRARALRQTENCRSDAFV